MLRRSRPDIDARLTSIDGNVADLNITVDRLGATVDSLADAIAEVLHIIRDRNGHASLTSVDVVRKVKAETRERKG